MDRPRTTAGGAQAWQPRTLRSAVAAMPAANLALISVPGDFAIAEARKALRAGLNVMIFSDNVAIADEAELKREARELGLLVMGPDCGTAIIGGVPLAFANVVPRGDIGIIGASGTGIQEVSCLIAQAGRGISHAIGTGGRDLKAEVGGITTLMAIDLLDADPATRHIVHHLEAAGGRGCGEGAGAGGPEQQTVLDLLSWRHAANDAGKCAGLDDAGRSRPARVRQISHHFAGHIAIIAQGFRAWLVRRRHAGGGSADRAAGQRTADDVERASAGRISPRRHLVRTHACSTSAPTSTRGDARTR